MSNTSENKRIAKNTIFLYLRMLVLLVVGLYTSRVILAALGSSDYGIYNVVGGIVTMFVFINYAMMNSTQRYLTYELGRRDYEKLSLVFSTSIIIHAIISVIIIVLTETVGLWFFYNKMNIPPERINAAFWVLQFSIISCFVNIMSVPFNALIIAHEKMTAFAYISMIDAVLKLGIAFLIAIYGGDRLILYALLILSVTVIDFIIYRYYCRQKFQEAKFKWILDKPLMSEMSKFASWNLLGNLAYVCNTQGLNLLLNVFFNPIVNAARGIAVQIQSVVSNFSFNIENALKPQITKSYAGQDIHRMHTLIIISAKLSYFVLLFFSLPILLETDQILHLWLTEVPEHTVYFVRLIILTLLAEALTNPLLTAAQATGDMKKYQLSVSLLSFLVLPLSYIALRFISFPEIVFVVYLVIAILSQFLKLSIVSKQIDLSQKFYLKEVFVRTIIVSFVSFILTSPFLLVMDNTFFRLISLSLFSCIVVLGTSYALGLNRNERQFVSAKVKEYITKYHKK